MKKKLLTVSSLFVTLTMMSGCGNQPTPSTHVHNYGDLVAAVNSTCEEDGHKAYYHCVDCDAFFNEDKEEVAYSDLITAALGHDWVKENGKPANCDQSGYKDYYDCSRCDEFAEDAEGNHRFTDLDAWKSGDGKIDAGQHELTYVAGVDSTCTTPGYAGHYECANCPHLFADAAGTIEITDLDAWKLDPNGGYLPAGHKAVEHEAHAPTGFNAGNSHYVQCSECLKYFSDHDCENEIEEGSWALDPTGTVTFDSAEQFEACTSKEGDELAFDKYGIGAQDGYVCALEMPGTHEGQAYNGYVMFPSLRGVRQISVKGSGQLLVRTAATAWSWETLANFTLSETEPIVLDLEADRYNSVILHGMGGRTLIKEFKFVSALEEASGTKDDDLFKNAIVGEVMASGNTYGYFTDKETNNSSSALLVGAECNATAWQFVGLSFREAIDVHGYNMSFDAKAVKGAAWISFTLYDANQNMVCQEIGFNITGEWAAYTYNCSATKALVKYVRITVASSSVSDTHENLIDNLVLVDAGTVTETEAGIWSYREFDPDLSLTEAQYIGKAVAIDFKPETATASLEIDYMSDANNYVGKKNYITVANGVPSSTFGAITANPEAGEGWYTLTVSEKNLCSYNRYSRSTTINGVYIATDVAMKGSVTINYGSFRAVDDIAPTRGPVTYTGPATGHTFWGNELIDVAFVSDFRSNESKVLSISFKVSGALGSTFGMNFADSGSGQVIFQTFVITVTADGLSTNHGVIRKGLDDYYTLYITAADLYAGSLNSANAGNYINVFWMGAEWWTIDSVTFDSYSFKIYQNGVLAL